MARRHSAKIGLVSGIDTGNKLRRRVSSKKNSTTKSPRSQVKFLKRDGSTGRMVAVADVRQLLRLGEAGFSAEEIHKIVIPRRTLERRMAEKQPFSEIESDRIVRLERLNAHAIRVFGSREKAHRWFRKPCRALDGAIPLELMASETGAHIVEEEIHAIDHGMFA